MIYVSNYICELGSILLAEENGSLIGAWLEGQKNGLKVLEGDTKEMQTPILTRTKAWLDRYFAGEKPEIKELETAPVGSEFQRAVWELLCEIPYGCVTTYGAIAKKIAPRTGKAKMSAQAIGGAVAHNPIAIIIPCHRVVGASGALVGYDGGLDIKARLLMHEGVDIGNLMRHKASAE